jgi:hypothetical protein
MPLLRNKKRAEGREHRAEGKEPRAGGKGQGAEGIGQRAESKEQRVKISCWLQVYSTIAGSEVVPLCPLL